MSDHDGERELILGNKQLLAIFFVAALLCGVFFAMGYVVGGNSAKSAAASAAATDSAPAPVAEGKREEPQPAPAADAMDHSLPSAATGDAGSQLPAAEPKIADNPVAAGPGPSPTTVIPPAPAAMPATPAAEHGVFVSVPETSASYWQVAAPQRPQADVLVKQLRDRGLPAIMAESSRPGLFRVLVGPYRSALTLADAKKKLVDFGFDGVFVYKQP
jgi:hypothetical protein